MAVLGCQVTVEASNRRRGRDGKGEATYGKGIVWRGECSSPGQVALSTACPTFPHSRSTREPDLVESKHFYYK